MNLLKKLYSLLPQTKKFYGELASKSNGKISVELVGGGVVSFAGSTDLNIGSKVWLMIDGFGQESITSAPDFDYFEIDV